MSDAWKFLPLSNRPRGDESQVTGDHRLTVAGFVDDAARLIAHADAAAAEGLTDRFLTTAHLAKEATASSPLVRLTALAESLRGGRKRGVGVLVRTTRALLALADAVGEPVAIDPRTCGTVVLWAATSGPFERRVVLSGHTVRATDAEWEFGRGPVIEGTSQGLAAFALGVSEIPPHAPTAPPH